MFLVKALVSMPLTWKFAKGANTYVMVKRVPHKTFFTRIHVCSTIFLWRYIGRVSDGRGTWIELRSYPIASGLLGIYSSLLDLMLSDRFNPNTYLISAPFSYLLEFSERVNVSYCGERKVAFSLCMLSRTRSSKLNSSSFINSKPISSRVILL